jgi:hypothetical protein
MRKTMNEVRKLIVTRHLNDALNIRNNSFSILIHNLSLNFDVLVLLLNSYSLWHRHKTTHAKVSTYFIRKKNLYEEKKSFVFNSVATKVVVDKSTIIRRNDVYAHSLLLSSISNTKNRLRDKSDERVFELV